MMMNRETALLTVSLAFYLKGGILSRLIPSRFNNLATAVSMGGAFAGSGARLTSSLSFLIGGSSFFIRLPFSNPLAMMSLFHRISPRAEGNFWGNSLSLRAAGMLAPITCRRFMHPSVIPFKKMSQ